MTTTLPERENYSLPVSLSMNIQGLPKRRAHTCTHTLPKEAGDCDNFNCSVGTRSALSPAPRPRPREFAARGSTERHFFPSADTKLGVVPFESAPKGGKDIPRQTFFNMTAPALSRERDLSSCFFFFRFFPGCFTVHFGRQHEGRGKLSSPKVPPLMSNESWIGPA